MGFRLHLLTGEEWRSSLRTAIAGLIAAAIALRWSGDNSVDVWYCLYGVARSNLADQRLSARLARERILGTLFGGAIGAGLVLLGNGWALVGVAYLLVELLGNRLGLSSGSRSNGTVAAVLLLMVPDYGRQGASWVLLRTLWHLIGLAIGMAVEHLLWPRGDKERLAELEHELIVRLQGLNREPDPAASQRLERQLVSGFRRIRELAEQAAAADPAAWAQRGGDERLRTLEQAVIHGTALVRHPLTAVPEGPLARRCIALDRCALARQLERLGAVAWAA